MNDQVPLKTTREIVPGRPAEIPDTLRTFLLDSVKRGIDASISDVSGIGAGMKEYTDTDVAMPKKCASSLALYSTHPLRREAEAEFDKLCKKVLSDLVAWRLRYQDVGACDTASMDASVQALGTYIGMPPVSWNEFDSLVLPELVKKQENVEERSI